MKNAMEFIEWSKWKEILFPPHKTRRERELVASVSSVMDEALANTGATIDDDGNAWWPE